ncbi:MAG: histidine kinase [Oscillospiraceae bacterium]|nr:histidine kinase [Oscillospiraceae bacterium]
MRWIKRFFHYCQNRFRYSNFFTKMVALFLVAAFLPLFLCSILFVTDTIQTSGENTAASIRNNFQQTYTVLNNRFSQIKKCADLLLNDAGTNDFLRNGTRETTFWEQRTFKSDMDNTIAFIESAQDIGRLRVYVDPDYFYILDSYHYYSMDFLNSQPWLVPVRSSQGRSIWLSSRENDLLDQAQNVLTNHNTLSYLVKGVDLTNMQRTAVVYQLDFSKSELEQQLQSSLVLNGSCAFVVDQDDQVIASAALGVAGELPESLADYTGQERVTIGGALYRVSRADFDAAPWSFVSLVPDESLFSYSDLDQVLFFILLAFIAGTIIFTSTLRFSRRVTQKIRSVVDGMEAVRHGEFRNLPATGTHDEIDELVDHYNYMVDELELLVEAKYLSGVELKAAQLRALQSQINPHFLYNTLEMINSYAFLENPQKVEQLVSALSRFYKLSLNHGKDIYQLWQELKLVEAYFQIQEIRYPGCLTLQIDVPSAMMQYAIPNITLQPLIENSISHGIMSKEDKHGRITILGRVLENAIQLQVIDDGVGMSPEAVAQLNAGKVPEDAETTGSRYGIYNINERIQNFYGGAYHLYFESVPGQGTVVTITLPPN